MSNSFGLEQQEEGKELLSYYWFERAFSPKQCADIIELGRQYPQISGTIFADDEKGKSSPVKVRNSTIRWIEIDNPETKWLTKELGRMATEANETLFKLDLYGFTENLQFTEYEGKGTHYGWHPDIGPGQNKRKLSIIVQLSDEKDYKGGELIINTGNLVSPDRSQGNVIFFPSFLLHKVDPLMSGNRYSLVCWISGNVWK